MRLTLFDLSDFSQEIDSQTKISIWDKEIFAQRVGEAYLSGYLQESNRLKQMTLKVMK